MKSKKKFQLKDAESDIVASLEVESVGGDEYLYLLLDGEIVLSICSDGTGDLYERDIAAALGNEKHTTEVHK